MKITLINGSPKRINSNSGIVLDYIKDKFPKDDIFNEFKFNTKELDMSIFKDISESDTLIIAFPLYVDGIPSHLLYNLAQMEEYFKLNPKPNIQVFTIVNCGFYEGRQGEVALEMVGNWCAKIGFIWRQGISIGGGGMLSMLSDSKNGPFKELNTSLQIIIENIKLNRNGKNIFTCPSMPRILYKFGGDYGWRSQAKENGLSSKDLNRRII